MRRGNRYRMWIGMALVGVSLNAGRLVAQGTVADKFTVTPERKQQAYTLLETVWKQSEGKNYYARESLPMELVAYDPDLALKLVRKPDGSIPETTLSYAIGLLAMVNPERALVWGLPKLETIKADQEYLLAVSMLGSMVADKHPDTAQELYRKAMARSKSLKAVADAPDFAGILLTVLAAKVKSPDAETILDKALAPIQKIRDTQKTDSILIFYAEMMAEASPALAEKVLKLVSKEQQEQATARAIQKIVAYDLPAARKLLDTLTNSGTRGYGESYGLAAKSVVRELGKSDPEAALKLARGVEIREHKPMALAIVAGFQKEKAGAVYREAAEAVGESGGVAPLAQIAALAYETDPATGKAIFAQAQKRLGTAEDKARTVSAFAFYYARIDPAESRRLLEGELEHIKAQPGTNADWDRLRVALGMTAVDISHALEIAKKIPGTSASLDAQRKIAQYILASEAVRRTLPFDRWNASDTWLPGTPTGW